MFQYARAVLSWIVEIIFSVCWWWWWQWWWRLLLLLLPSQLWAALSERNGISVQYSFSFFSSQCERCALLIPTFRVFLFLLVARFLHSVMQCTAANIHNTSHLSCNNWLLEPILGWEDVFIPLKRSKRTIKCGNPAARVSAKRKQKKYTEDFIKHIHDATFVFFYVFHFPVVFLSKSTFGLLAIFSLLTFHIEFSFSLEFHFLFSFRLCFLLIFFLIK